MKLYNIPAHTNCTNCGQCCGVIPASDEEVQKIRKYVKVHGIKARAPGVTCPFRNEEEKKCDIYPVRPIICRLFGVIDTGLGGCPNGNSASINGRKYIKPGKGGVNVLNFIDWRE